MQNKLTNIQKEVVKKMYDGYSVDYEISVNGHCHMFSVDGVDCPFGEFFMLLFYKFISKQGKSFVLTSTGKEIGLSIKMANEKNEK